MSMNVHPVAAPAADEARRLQADLAALLPLLPPEDRTLAEATRDDWAGTDPVRLAQLRDRVRSRLASAVMREIADRLELEAGDLAVLGRGAEGEVCRLTARRIATAAMAASVSLERGA